jgi:glyceraldehyde 3-phosphate dehydrogenase
MAIRIGINGLGRIGRGLLRRSLREPDLRVVAVNDVADPAIIAHLLRHDSVAGPLGIDLRLEGTTLRVGDAAIRCTRSPQPGAIPWGEAGVDVVIEATGCFASRAAAAAHLKAGAPRVIISCPSRDADLTVCYGVNHEAFDPERHRVISNASCTTNGTALVLSVLERAYGIERAAMTTIHCTTNNQVLVDAPHVDRRRARAAGLSMIPTSTSAAEAVVQVLPGLRDRLHCLAVRVPTAAVSMLDLTVSLARPTGPEAVRALFRQEATGRLSGILGYNDEELVSIDYVGDRCSATIDGPLLAMQGDRFLKVYAWYDNESGYVQRLIDLMRSMARRMSPGRNA